jgi:hypothetical protein
MATNTSMSIVPTHLSHLSEKQFYDEYGHLSVEDFLAQQCEHQIQRIYSHCDSLIATFEERTSEKQEQLKKQQN